MCWQFGKNDFFHFITTKDEVYFEIVFDQIPSSYNKAVHDLFILQSEYVESQEIKYYIYAYTYKNDGQIIINQPRKHEKSLDPDNSEYLVDQRRIFEKSSPQIMTIEDIASVICNKKILFYTGAGISIASEIPSMNQLNDLLGFKEENFVNSLKGILSEPTEFAKKINQFHNACFFRSPTAAHEALKKIALYKNVKIITENLDCLHEYSGILPYRINAEQLREEVTVSQLEQIDYIICVGLSYDDRGFLGWYKRNNPKGRIISIDLGNPSYLGKEDFIIKEDLQFLIPMLATKVLESDYNN